MGLVPTLRIRNIDPSFTTHTSTCTLDTTAGSSPSLAQHALPIGTTGPTSAVVSFGGHANGSSTVWPSTSMRAPSMHDTSGMTDAAVRRPK